MSDIKRPEIFIGDLGHGASINVLKQIDHIEQTYPTSQPIIVHINSYGGSVHEMGIIYNRLKTMEHPLISYTSSSAMSAGAILLSTIAPKGRRFAAPGSIIMVHEIQAGTFGDIKSMEDRFKNIKQLNKYWMNLLAKSMGLKSQVAIRDLIKEHAIGQDVFLSAEKAKELGLVDEVCLLRPILQSKWLIERVK